MRGSKQLAELMPGILKTARVPGLSIALVENGQLSYQQGFGVKSVDSADPVTTETIFEAASLTKPLFAYLALLMFDDERLELDKPLVSYLDTETIEAEILQHPIDAEGFRLDWFERVTARHVLSHSSGMPHTERGMPFPLFFEPGSAFKYSASGFYFLQRVIEKLEGKPLEKITETKIFKPLSMSHSSMIWQDRFGANACNGHDLRSRPTAIRKYQRAHAAASMYTTVGDYARFIIAVLDGKGLSRTSMKAMLTPQIAITEDEYWGLGFGISQSHLGDALWQWGDYGIFQNYAIAYPSVGKALVYLSNSNNGLGIRDAVLTTLIGPACRTSTMLSNYIVYDSPAVLFAWVMLEEDANSAFQQLPSLRKPDAPLDWKVLNQLGKFLMDEERIEDAAAVYELSLGEQSSPTAGTYFDLANAYLGRGDDDLALENFEKVLELLPRYSDSGADHSTQIREQARQSIADLKLRRVKQ